MTRTCRPSDTYRGSHEDPATLRFLHLPPEVLASVIFCCSDETITECLENMIFGLPHPHFAYVQNVQPGMPLFLFNYSGRKMHGVFEAVSCGQMNINPHGWTRCTGKTPYPAQVRVKVIQLYPSLPEIIFKEVLIRNFYTEKHFCFELDSSQTSKLWSLFVKIPSEAVIEPLKISTCYKASLQHNEEDNPYLARSPGSLCCEWEAAGDAERTNNQPSRSSIILSSHLSIDPSCRGEEHRESQCSDWEHSTLQQREYPETRLDVLFPELHTQNLEIAEMLMGLRSLQALLMQGTSHETNKFPAVQSSVPHEWTYSQSFNLSAYQNVDMELEETGWEHRFLQHQKQQPEARLNVSFVKPNDVISPDIDLLKITQLSKDLQYPQTLMLQRGFQERKTVPTIESSDIQEMADARELEELSENRCLQEQAMLREELFKQRESLRVRDISSDNGIQELRDLSARTEVEEMRWHRSELKHIVKEACAELGYFKEVDELRQRNTMLEYTQRRNF